MRSTNQIEVVPIQELCHHVWSKGKTNASIILAPSLNVFIRIRPQEVAKQASVWDVSGPHNAPDLLHVLEVGREAAVATEDFLVDQCSDGQAVETVCEGFPQLYGESPLA